MIAPTPDEALDVGHEVVAELAKVIAAQVDGLDWPAVAALVEALDHAGKVLVFGAGRSGAMATAFGQRLTHVGLDVAAIGEAGNTRLGAQDVVLLISGSGATVSTVSVAAQSVTAGVGTIALITTNPASELAAVSQVVCPIAVRGKGSALSSIAPYTAQFDACTLVLSEVVARMIMVRRGITDEEIERWRPNVE